MNKSFLILLTLMISGTLSSKSYFTKNGLIIFKSHAPMEDIKAENRKVVSTLNPDSGDLSFSLLIKSFDFPNNLMEEHFNESYLESDKYPKAVFKGKITNISKVDFTKDGKYTVNFTGKLTIKNVTKSISDTAVIQIKGGKVTASSKISVKPKDYNIAIPSSMASKIAETVEVSIKMEYLLKP